MNTDIHTRHTTLSELGSMVKNGIYRMAKFPEIPYETQEKFFTYIKNPWKGLAAGKVVFLTGQVIDIIQGTGPMRNNYTLIAGGVACLNEVSLKYSVHQFKKEFPNIPDNLDKWLNGSLVMDAMLMAIFGTMKKVDEDDGSEGFAGTDQTPGRIMMLLACMGFFGFVVSQANKDNTNTDDSTNTDDPDNRALLNP